MNNPQIIYQSHALRAVLYPAANGLTDKLLCRFDYYDHGKVKFAPIRPTPKICAQNFNVLKIETATNNWFLTHDSDDLAQSLENITKGYAHSFAICFSMGITGALMFSKQLNLQRFVAFSPLVSIFDDDIPDNRFNHIKHLIECPDHYDKWKDGNCNIEGTLCFDPYVPMDVKQACLVQKYYKNLKSVALPHTGHPCSFVIQNHFGFQSMQNQLIDNDFSPLIIRDMHRASRKQSAHYKKVILKRRNIVL